jgi:hypothetical protein
MKSIFLVLVSAAFVSTNALAANDVKCTVAEHTNIDKPQTFTIDAYSSSPDSAPVTLVNDGNYTIKANIFKRRSDGNYILDIFVERPAEGGRTRSGTARAFGKYLPLGVQFGVMLQDTDGEIEGDDHVYVTLECDKIH